MSTKLLGNRPKGSLFVISAPAGAGKSTLVNMLLDEFPEAIEESCSCTTRKARHSEIKKKDYEFLTIEEFEAKIAEGAFLEYAKVFRHYYGTPKSEVERILESGKHAILVIDTQGAMALKGRIDATFIFIFPPSLEELQRRLIKRSTETEESIFERLSWAEKEMTLAEQYDYQIVNDDLQIGYQVLRSIIIAEEHKKR